MTDERILTRCPKCKTRTLKREGKELVCSTCHGRFPEAESPEVASHGHVRHRMTRAQVQERHRYYEDNKEAILTDLKSMGIPATAKKWKIPYATVNTLRRRWGAEDDPRGRNTTWDKHEHYEKHKDEAPSFYSSHTTDALGSPSRGSGAGQRWAASAAALERQVGPRGADKVA